VGARCYPSSFQCFLNSSKKTGTSSIRSKSIQVLLKPVLIFITAGLNITSRLSADFSLNMVVIAIITIYRVKNQNSVYTPYIKKRIRLY